MKASPIPFTQREVDSLVAGKTAPAVRRLRSGKPATSKTKPSGDQDGPHPISRKQMRAIQAGRFPADLKKRIEARSQPEPPARAYAAGEEKTAPSAAPPRPYAKPTRKKK